MKKIFILPMLILLCALLSFQAVQGQGAADVIRRHQNKVTNEYIVVFKNDVRFHEVGGRARGLARAFGGEVFYTYRSAIKGFAVRLPEAAAIALSRNPVRRVRRRECGSDPLTGNFSAC